MRRGPRSRTCSKISARSIRRYRPAVRNGQVRRFVNLYLNDEDVRYLDNLNPPVKDGDEVSIIPAVAGG